MLFIVLFFCSFFFHLFINEDIILFISIKVTIFQNIELFLSFKSIGRSEKLDKIFFSFPIIYRKYKNFTLNDQSR